MSEEIRIEKAVLHVLDSSMNMPVLSNGELDNEGETTEFLEKHIQKMFQDNNLKPAAFIGGENKIRFLCECLSSQSEDFLPISLDIAKELYDIMVKNVDIPPADLLCCLFSHEGQRYLGILKMNYKTGYTHFVRQAEEGNVNDIIKHKALLPSDGQKVDECVFVNLQDCAVRLIEKEYEINGEKLPYMSALFLKCSTDFSANDKLKILNKVTQKINKKYFDDDFEKTAKLKKVVAERLEEEQEVPFDTIAEEVFQTNMEVRKEYIEEVQKAGLTERAISLPENMTAKKFKTHRIKTDTGIEINFPLTCFDDKNKIEFINNPDGTISIIMRNITRIVNS